MKTIVFNVAGIVKKEKDFSTEIMDSSSSNIMSFAPSAGQQRQQSVLKITFLLYSSSTAK